MNEDLDGIISRIKDLARNKQEKEAMTLATGLVESHPGEMKVWSTRAFLYALGKNYDEAVSDLTQAIGLNSMEPVFFWNRGCYESRLARFDHAVKDFDKGLELCDHYKDDYYREALHFFRAEALIELGRKHDAANDLSHVRDDFSFWTYKLRTKAELLALITELPS
jgi:tetratricopeptide (TPR) repeat protein